MGNETIKGIGHLFTIKLPFPIHFLPSLAERYRPPHSGFIDPAFKNRLI